MKTSTRNMLLAAAFLICLLFPIVDRNAFHVEIAATCLIFVLLALGLNVIVGYVGLLNLGYAAFFAVGAYTYGLLNLHAHFSFWTGLPIAMIVCALVGVLLAFPAVRLRGDYLAIVSLGFGEIVRITLNNLDTLTGGPNGLLGLDHPKITYPGMAQGQWSWKTYDFSVASTPYFYLALVMAAGLIYGIHKLHRSRIGRTWVAVREDELAAASVGVNVNKTKLLACGLGAAVAGAAGCLFAAKQGSISPDSFDFIVSVMIVAMVVLGGVGSTAGAVLGAIVLTVMPELLRGFATYRMLLFGLAMILITLFRPQGLLGEARHAKELKIKEEEAPA